MSQSILSKPSGKILGRPARFWHKRVIPNNFSGELVFFNRSSSSNKRVSNLETMGQTTGYSEFILRRLALIFAPGTSEADIAQVLEHCHLTLKIGSDEKAAEILGWDAPPGSGLQGTGVVTVGVPSPRDAFDLSGKAVPKNTPWFATLRGASDYGLKMVENVYVTLAAEVFLFQPREPR